MKCKTCSRSERFFHLVKKLRYYLFATLVLLAAGLVFFLFLRRVLLESYQHTETNLAQSYALEVEGGLNTYETLISYGTHMIDAGTRKGTPRRKCGSGSGRYCLRIQTVLDEQVDPYVVYGGQIITANPGTGTPPMTTPRRCGTRRPSSRRGGGVHRRVHRCDLQPGGGDGGPEVRRQRRGGGHGHLPRKPGHPARGGSAPRRGPPSLSVIPAGRPSSTAPTWTSPRTRSRTTSTGSWRRWRAAAWPGTTPLSRGWTGCGGASTTPTPARAGRSSSRCRWTGCWPS